MPIIPTALFSSVHFSHCPIFLLPISHAAGGFVYEDKKIYIEMCKSDITANKSAITTILAVTASNIKMREKLLIFCNDFEFEVRREFF